MAFQLWRLRWAAAHHWPTRLAMALAWRLPRWLVYWAFVRMATEGTRDYPGDQRIIDVMEHWRRA